MNIKIYASVKEQSPTSGPYRTIDVVQRDCLYQMGEMTHYGEVVLFLPPVLWLNDGVEQGVVVKLDPTSLGTWCEESVMEKPPASYEKIQFFPIRGAVPYWSEGTPLAGPYELLPSENLTVENISHLVTRDTFSLWKKGCNISKRTAESLDSIKFAIVRRHSSSDPSDGGPETYSTWLIDCAVSCLGLIRPTGRSHAMHIRGTVNPDGSLDPRGFSAREDLVDVPEVQKLFAVREEDVKVLIGVLPEFMQLYRKDRDGKLTDDYEPLRMAIQLYGEGYLLSYWKASHILWWSAIEALYGDNKDAATARIYSFFGNKNLAHGHNCTIYEKGDIPSCFHTSPICLHTLGEMVSLIYEVRNASAHGQKVADSHFAMVPHPFGQGVTGLSTLAEAATFIVRKTVIEVLRRGLRERFIDRAAREDFWLREHGLDKKQSKKRLRELDELLLRTGHT